MMMIGRSLPFAAMSFGALRRHLLALQLGFEITKCRTQVRGEQLAGELDRDGRDVAAHGCDERHLHNFKRLALFIGVMLHRSRDGADETVGNENSEEGTHE